MLALPAACQSTKSMDFSTVNSIECLPLGNFPENSLASAYTAAPDRALRVHWLWRLMDLVTWDLHWGFTGVIFRLCSPAFYGCPVHQQGHIFSISPAGMMIVQKQGVTSKHGYYSRSAFLTCDQGVLGQVLKVLGLWFLCLKSLLGGSDAQRERGLPC